MEQFFEQILGKLDKIDSKIDRLSVRVEQLETKQDEIYNIASAIEESNRFNKAEVDNMSYKIAYLEKAFVTSEQFTKTEKNII